MNFAVDFINDAIEEGRTQRNLVSAAWSLGYVAAAEDHLKNTRTVNPFKEENKQENDTPVEVVITVGDPAVGGAE